jgi:Flp pilus assembly protein TadG
MPSVNRRSRYPNQRKGTAVVEAALVLPILILFVMGVMEYSIYFMTVHTLRNAAREGAKYAATHTSTIYLNSTSYGNATSDVTSLVTDRIGTTQLTDQAISVFKSDSTGINKGTWTDAAAGDFVCVQISGTYRFCIPRLLSLATSTTLAVQAVRRSEGN